MKILFWILSILSGCLSLFTSFAFWLAHGFDLAWVIETAEIENTFDFNTKEGAKDPAGRLTLALTPFSQYK